MRRTPIIYELYNENKKQVASAHLSHTAHTSLTLCLNTRTVGGLLITGGVLATKLEGILGSNLCSAKGDGLQCPGWWECSLAAISQTTTHMHGHHEATMGLAGVSLGRELRALALSHTASVRRGTA